MKISENELFILYHSERELDRKCLSTAKALATNVKESELNKKELTARQFQSILDTIAYTYEEVLDKSHEDYKAFRKEHTKDLDGEGWLRFLINNPDLIRGPIVIKGKKGMLCTSTSDVKKVYEGMI